MQLRRLLPVALLLFVLFGASMVAHAWTGPTGTAPGNNVAAPVNVGSTAQYKSGNLGVGQTTLPVFTFESNGSSLINGHLILYGTSRYLNFGTNSGSGGYGLRDNAGTMEYRNSSGSWVSFALSGVWTTSGTSIYNNNTGNVGVGVTAPDSKLEVSGTGAAPSLSADTGILKVSGNVTQELAFGEYTTGPFAFWIQTKRSSNDGTSWPLSLNPLGGNVGINTSNPTQRFTVEQPDSGWDSGIGLKVTGSATTWKIIADSNSPVGSMLTIAPNNDYTKGFVIANGGNMGIGNSSPRAKLEVTGSILNTAAYNANNNLSAYDAGFWSIGAGGSIYSYGFICAGNSRADCANTNPGTGSVGTIMSAAGLRFPDGTLQTTAAAGIGGSGTTGYMSRWTGAATLGNSSITSDGVSSTAQGNFFATGYVAATGQSSKFGAAAGSASSPTVSNTNIILYNNSASNWSGIGSDVSGNMYFTAGTAGVATRMMVAQTGNVGVNTVSPAQRFSVEQAGSGWDAGIGLKVAGSATTWKFLADGGASATMLTIAPNNDYSKGIILNNGNMGVGNQSPVYKLDVNGEVVNTSQASTYGNTALESFGLLNRGGGTSGNIYIEPVPGSQFIVVPSDWTQNLSSSFNGTMSVGVSITAPQYCIGSSCINAWPSGISGSGSSGYIPRWTGNSPSTSLGNSSITSDGVSSTAQGNFFVTGGSYTNDYFRVNGSGGLYWQNWDGGWYMSDATWVRSYGNKNVYTGGQMRADGGFCIGASCINSWPTAETLDSVTGRGWQTAHLLSSSGGFYAANDAANPNYRAASLHAGDANHAGYIEWKNTVSNRLGYMGWDNANVALSLESGANFVVSGGSTYIYNGAANSHYTAFERGNEINAYTSGASSDTMYLNFSSTGNVNIGRSALVVANSGGTTANGNLGVGGYVSASGQDGNGFSFVASHGIWTQTNVSAVGNMSAAAFIYNSDRRLKKDIAPLSDNLAKVLALQPVSYHWIDPKQPQTNQIGFIAQDVEKVVPELVYTNASTTMKGVDYARVTPLLVGSVQELNAKINKQQAEIDELKAEIQAMKKQ